MIIVVKLTAGRADLEPWLDANCFRAGLSTDYRPVYHVAEGQADRLIRVAKLSLTWEEADDLIESVQRDFARQMMQGA